MSGHSQFKNIMHRKGAQDKIRARTFSKLGREITVAAKSGLPDPAYNPRLRAAIAAARAENMPKDNIKRAIEKAAAGDAANYEEIRYEGFGPGNVAVIVEALTDNPKRTAPIVRSIFGKAGCVMGETGSVAFNFQRVGLIEYPASVAEADAMFEAALEAGADDVESDEETHRIFIADSNSFFSRYALYFSQLFRCFMRHRAVTATSSERHGCHIWTVRFKHYSVTWDNLARMYRLFSILECQYACEADICAEL